MLIHTTTVYKAKRINFYKDHDPILDKEYNDWISSLPGVLSVTNTVLSQIKMERIIGFTDEAAYQNWLALRKAQPSWKARRKYEKRYGIMSTSTREEI
jgi:hypothetical protein